MLIASRILHDCRSTKPQFFAHRGPGANETGEGEDTPQSYPEKGGLFPCMKHIRLLIERLGAFGKGEDDARHL